MDKRELRTILDRIRSVRHACDLDLLLFFYRHPRALLTAERLISYVGYDREQVARSLDGMIEAGLLSRSQNPSHTARLYVLQLDAFPGGLLGSFLRLAATRQGRGEVLRLLATPDPAPRAELRRASNDGRG